MCWAHRPDEVPPFDPSRGADPYWPFGDTGSEEQTVRIISLDLGGSEPPPAFEWPDVVHDEVDGHEWLWEMPVPNYPRLVRVSPSDTGEKPGQVNALEALTRLSQIVENDAFMAEAAQLASSFGALAYGMLDATLDAWRSTARELDAHCWLLKRLSDVAEFAPSPGLAMLDAIEHRELEQIIKEANRATTFQFPAARTLLKAITAAETAQELRQALAAMYWEEFQRQLRPYAHRGAYFRTRERPDYPLVGLVDVGGPGQIVARCGSRGWAFYELWSLAQENRGIRQCEGCGLLFEPARKDARHCRDSCRVKAHRGRRSHAAAGG